MTSSKPSAPAGSRTPPTSRFSRKLEGAAADHATAPRVPPLRNGEAPGRRESPLLLRGRRCGRLNQLEIELSFAFDKEQTLRGRIAARRVPVVAARLQEIRSGAEPEFRLALRSLDVSPGHDHDLHVVRVRVQGSSESGRQLEEGPEWALRVIAPQIGNLDSGGATRVEIRPFQVARKHNDEPAFRCSRGALAFHLSKQYRRRSERDQ